MTKTLKSFIEGYLKVKNPDEQKFVDKHVVAKHSDRNGNGDDVFQATNIKKIERKKERHGYDAGDDEKVYEELKGGQKKLDKNKNGKLDADDFKLLRNKKMKEEVEELEELSTATLQSYRKKARAQGNAIVDKMKMGAGDWSKDQKDTKTLRKRSSGAQMSGKQLRKRGESLKTEETELDESAKIAAHLIKRYGDNVRKSHVVSAAKDFGVDASKLAKTVRAKLGKTTLGEERVDEVLTAKTPMSTYIKDFQKSDAPQFKGKSKEKRRVMAIAAKLTAERGGKPLRKEETLADLLGDLIESHRRTMLSVFDKLNEDNQKKFLEACQTEDGIESMLDFSISHRGE